MTTSFFKYEDLVTRDLLVFYCFLRIFLDAFVGLFVVVVLLLVYAFFSLFLVERINFLKGIFVKMLAAVKCLSECL